MKIKQILSVLTLGLLFAFPTQAAYSIPAIVTTDLNVRQFPNKDAKIINVLPQGAKVDAFDSGNPNWNKINFGDYVGYVYNAYLTSENTLTTSNTQKSSEVKSNTQNSVKTEQSNTQNTITTKETETSKPVIKETENSQVERLYEPSDFKYLGVLNYDGWQWTWYTEKQLPGQGLNIPGRHTNSDGYVCDENEYICLASVDLSQGTVVRTPLGYFGKVYDTGCPHGVLDVYTNF